MAFQVGTAFTCTVVAKDANGAAVDLKALGASYTWTGSDPSLIFDDNTSASPKCTGGAPLTGATVSVHVAYSISGTLFTHDGTSAAFDVVAVAPSDPVVTLEVTVA